MRVQEPAVKYHAPGEPAAAEQNPAEDIADKRRNRGRARFTAEARVQFFAIRLEHLAAVVAARMREHLGRDQARLDRRPYTFAAFRIRQSRGVAHEQYAVIEQATA